MTLIDWLVVLGVGVVVPLALREPFLRWAGAAALVTVSFTLAAGPVGGLLVVPFGVAAVDVARRHVGAAGPLLLWDEDTVVRVIASVYVTVASGALVVSRLGLRPLGLREPIIELTAIHYIYAGAAALVLAGATRRILPAVLTATAPPVVAIGFVTGWAVPQVGGAVLMTLGVWATATHELRVALDRSNRAPARILMAVSGLAIWAPMVLAVAWAAGQHWSVPILSIPDMARTHGVANALGFVVCGLVARRATDRDLVPV